VKGDGCYKGGLLVAASHKLSRNLWGAGIVLLRLIES
jgi:hypothetical protein